MTNRGKYLLCNIFDWALTWGGTAAVIVANYLEPYNPLPYKLTLTGIILVVALIFVGKANFERSYRKKYDNLLQQLAYVTNADDKEAINKKIEQLKIQNTVIDRVIMILPFVVVYVVTKLADYLLVSLGATAGLIIVSMGAGSIFNVVKQPYYDKAALEKITGNKRSK